MDLEPLRNVAEHAIIATSSHGRRDAAALGAVTARSRFRIASLTKAVTAAATVRATQRVGLSLDTAIAKLLPTPGDEPSVDAGLTIADVLSQTSGLSPSVTAGQVADPGEGDEALLAAARLALQAGHVRPAGARWEYYNGNYFVAGAVLAALAATSYEQAVDELVLSPWAMESTGFADDDLVPGHASARPVAGSPYPRGRRPSGGLCSTATDLLSLGERLLDDADLLAELGRVRTAPDDPMRYGLGWAVGPSGQMYLNGRLPGYRAALLLVPDHRLVAVGLAAETEALPALAQALSDVQRDLTGDDLAADIDSFAA